MFKRSTFLATIVCLGAFAGTASAQSSAPVSSAGGSEGGDTNTVATDIRIIDASDQVVSRLQCEWTGEPAEDDMPCIKFQGDPQTAFAAIEAAGGVRAEQTTKDNFGEMAISFDRRADNTWLIRSEGTVSGQKMNFGRVCTPDGQRCERWDAGSSKFAAKKIAKASTKLKNRAKRNKR